MPASLARRKRSRVDQGDPGGRLDQYLSCAGMELAPVHGGAVGADQLPVQPHRRLGLDRGQLRDQALNVDIIADVQQKVEIGAAGQVVQPGQGLPGQAAEDPRLDSMLGASVAHALRASATRRAGAARWRGPAWAAARSRGRRRSAARTEIRRLPAKGGKGRPSATPAASHGMARRPISGHRVVGPARDEGIAGEIVGASRASSASRSG